MHSMNLAACRITCALIALLGSSMEANAETMESEPLDLVIHSGKVVDGTGAPWYYGDVGIRDGKIVAIGRLEKWESRDRIDASGLVVAPGFIDMMGQTATPMLERPSTAENLLQQGITTINAGEGSSAAPLDPEEACQMGWSTMAEYFQMLDLKGLPVNVAQTVGHTQVRTLVMGDADRRPTAENLEQMKQLTREAMESGAIGVSTALIYPPAVYADTREIAALASVCGEYGGSYFTHMRNEGDLLLDAVEEALDIGAMANTPVHIFHLKAAGKRNWGKMQLAIAKIKEARAAGSQVSADIYPYNFNGLGLEALIHPRHFVNGREKFLRSLSNKELQTEIREEIETTDGWENWYRHAGSDWNRVLVGNSSSEKYSQWHGESIAAMADATGDDPWDVFFELVQSSAFAMPITMSDANIVAAMQEEFISFCTDVGPASQSRSVSHPRSHGAFPRLFGHYVRDLDCISLEQAVAQASAVAANEIMAFDRGRIALGLPADLIVFKLDQIADKAKPGTPRAMPTGMKHVVVNGIPALRDGKMTRARAGYVLRGPGYDESKSPARMMTGVGHDSLAKIDALMRDYLAKNRAPGASLAISKDGRLVYARGFGYADVASRDQVQPDSLFRLASVSKPLTAVAILQLVEAGKLDLETNVFTLLDEYEAHLEPDAELDERQQDITVRHLLQHRGGWDRDVSFDGMFQSVRFARAMNTPSPAGHDEIIACMLGLPLDFAPGERYAYSNYGYCLLGRIIEKVSGLSYEEYVKQYVLEPIGVTKAAIGATSADGRQHKEVRYYDPAVTQSVFADSLHQRVPAPYGAWCLESMDSHGAWIASAVDLTRFADAFNDAKNSPLLEASSIEEMFERPDGLAGHTEDGGPKGEYYTLGWQNSENADGPTLQMHGGSLPGTSTKLVRRSDGWNFALLFNARESAKVSRLAEGILDDLHAALDASEVPEDVDLYGELQ